MEKQKPEVGKAILFSIVGLAAFYICYFVLALLLGLLFALLLNIPVLKNIIAFLFRLRGDTPDALVTIAAVYVSYSAIIWMLGRFCDIQETLFLSHRILGIILLVLNVLFLLVNISSGNSFFPNIVVGIAGFIMFLKGKQ